MDLNLVAAYPLELVSNGRRRLRVVPDLAAYNAAHGGQWLKSVGSTDLYCPGNSRCLTLSCSQYMVVEPL